MTLLYLASGSPRRRELLTQIGIPFSSLSAAIDETPLPAELAEAYVERLAREKACAGLASLPQGNNSPVAVLGADTAVVLEGRILGKPQHREDALAMLAALSGRQHQVLTAVAVADHERCLSVSVSSHVLFAPSAPRKPRPTGPAASRPTRRAAMPYRAWVPFSYSALKAAIRRWSACL